MESEGRGWVKKGVRVAIVWEWSRTSKQVRGCIGNSFSPGYCERKLMDAPASMHPTSISSTVPRSLFTPLYAKAVSLLVVADIRPNSTGGGTKRNMCTLFVGERRKERHNSDIYMDECRREVCRMLNCVVGGRAALNCGRGVWEYCRP
jgi:hypothetical protein